MIMVSRLNGKEFVLNADWIETVEKTPDTVITLTGGNKYVVSESVDEVIDRVIRYKQRCFPQQNSAAEAKVEEERVLNA